MAFPTFGGSPTTDTVSAGADGGQVDLAAPAGVAAGDYQIVVIAYATGTTSFSEPAGWIKAIDVALTSPTSGGSGSGRMVIYERDAENDPGAAAFSCTTGAVRVFAAVRAYWTLPEGSTGRTAAMQSVAEASGTASTTHTLPSVTTSVAESLVIGIGVADQTNPPAATLTWDGWGSLTERVDFQGGNASEIQSIGIADLQVASPATVSGQTVTTSSADEVGLVAIILNGAGEAPGPDPAARTRGFLSILLGD